DQSFRNARRSLITFYLWTSSGDGAPRIVASESLWRISNRGFRWSRGHGRFRSSSLKSSNALPLIISLRRQILRTAWCRTALARVHLAVSLQPDLPWLLILSASSVVS